MNPRLLSSCSAGGRGVPGLRDGLIDSEGGGALVPKTKVAFESAWDRLSPKVQKEIEEAIEELLPVLRALN